MPRHKRLRQPNSGPAINRPPVTAAEVKPSPPDIDDRGRGPRGCRPRCRAAHHPPRAATPGRQINKAQESVRWVDGDRRGLGRGARLMRCASAWRTRHGGRTTARAFNDWVKAARLRQDAGSRRASVAVELARDTPRQSPHGGTTLPETPAQAPCSPAQRRATLESLYSARQRQEPAGPTARR